jgi:hypothetical protein
MSKENLRAKITIRDFNNRDSHGDGDHDNDNNNNNRKQ